MPVNTKAAHGGRKGGKILFRKKNDCEHCEKIIEAQNCEKQALAQQEKMFLQEYERKQKVITWLIAENQALHKMLEEKPNGQGG